MDEELTREDIIEDDDMEIAEGTEDTGGRSRRSE